MDRPKTWSLADAYKQPEKVQAKLGKTAKAADKKRVKKLKLRTQMYG